VKVNSDVMRRLKWVETSTTLRAPPTLFGRSLKENSQKVVCRMLHSPARWLLYSLPETSLLLKVDHYMLDVRIFMRTDGCAIFLQNTDTDTGVGGSQEFRPRVCY
jgi:hypothetical protein